MGGFHHIDVQASEVLVAMMSSAAESPQMLDALAAVPDVVQTLLALTRDHSGGLLSFACPLTIVHAKKGQMVPENER